MRPVATYTYRTARGKVAFFKDRFEPKRFKYRWPNGDTVTTSEVSELPQLLYGLPELTSADPTGTVFVAEGEKDCDALVELGLIATCNYDGAGRGKWQASYNRYFNGRNVVILPDNDKPGRDHAQEIARSLVGVAASVKLVDLPGLPKKGDVSDWLAAGGTVRELTNLSASVPPWRQRIELERPSDRFSADWDLHARIETVLNLKLMAQEKLLLVVLEAKIKQPRPTQRTIAAAVGTSPGRVKKILADLRKRGIISARKHGRENMYVVRI
jgi:DNA primase